MKAIKRTVAAILATLMLATSTSFTLAAEYNYSAKDAEAVGKVSAAGIMVGDENGDFMPEKSLTRAEAAKIIVVMKGISDSAVKAAAGTTMFNDVEATNWASGYINQASKLGIVKGVSATEFAPTREVTIQEFVTMAVRALGAGQLVDSEGTWPSNYVNFANENKILDDVNSLPANTAKRVEAAMIVKNCLTTEMWGKTQVKTNGEITWAPNGKTILGDVLGLTEKAGGITPGYVNAKDHLIDGVDVNEKFDLSNIKAGIKYHAYMKDGEIQGLWIEDDTIEFTSIAKEYDDDDEVITLTVDGKEKEYKLAKTSTLKYIYNEDATKGATIVSLDTEDEIQDFFGTITVNDDNEIVSMSLYQFTNYFVVDEVTKSTVKADSTVNGMNYAASGVKFNDEDNDYTLTKNGKAISFSDLEEGDAVRYYVVEDYNGKEDNDKIVGEVISPVTGKVTAKGNDYIKLDGTKYKTVLFDDDPSDVYLADGIKVNDEIDAYLNNSNKVVMYKVVEEDKDNSVAIVSYKKAYTSKYADELGNYDIKLTFMDGETSNVLSVDYADTYKEIKNKVTAIKSDKTAVTINGVELDCATLSTNVLANITSADKDKIGKAFADSVLNLGEVIVYEIKGDELTLSIVDDEFNRFTNTDVKGIKVDSKYTYLSDMADSNRTKVAYIGKDTKVFEVEEDKTYSWTVKEISVDDLEDTTFENTNDVFVVGYDEDTKECDYVIINSEKFKRTTEANFAYVKEVSVTKYDDKDAQEVTFVMMNGKEESYIYAPEEADVDDLDFTAAGFKAGCIVDLEVKGELIMNATAAAAAVGKDKITVADADVYVKDVIGNRLILTDGASREVKQDLVLAEDVLVIRLKEDNAAKFKAVKDITDIKEYDSNDDNDVVRFVWSYTDDDEETTVIAVFYTEAE